MSEIHTENEAPVSAAGIGASAGGLETIQELLKIFWTTPAWLLR